MATLACALALVAAPACHRGSHPAAPGAGSLATELPRRWSDLHLPTDGLQQIQARTDEHGYYADYVGRDDAPLLDKISATLRQAGYAPACNLFDGHVRGFSKGEDQLVAKTIRLGPPLSPPEGTLALSIVDQRSRDATMHDVCFGKSKLGAKTTSYGGLLESYPVEPSRP